MIEIKKEKGIATISFNSGKHNTFSRQVLDEISTTVMNLGIDNSVDCILFHPGNNAHFGTGAKIEDMANLSEKEAIEYSQFGQSVMNMIEASEKPTIAAIDGYCLGGALELAMACNYRISTLQARFGLPENKLSLLCPGWGGTQRIQYHVGIQKAEEMLTLGKNIRGLEAYMEGLVDCLVSKDILQETTRLIRENKLMSRSKLNLEYSSHLPNSYDSETELFASAFRNGTPNGIRIFLEGRK